MILKYSFNTSFQQGKQRERVLSYILNIYLGLTKKVTVNINGIILRPLTENIRLTESGLVAQVCTE